MTKKLIKTLIIGMLTVCGGVTPVIAIQGFPQSLLGMQVISRQVDGAIHLCLTDKDQHGAENQQIQNLSGGMITGEEEQMIETLNLQLAEAYKCVNEKSSAIDQLIRELDYVTNKLNTSSQDLADASRFLAGQKQEIQILTNAQEKTVLENAELLKRYDELLKLLSLAGIDMGTLDIQALIHAAGRGDIENVKALIKAGVDPRAKDSQALVVAAAEGHLEVVKMLVEAGADPRAQYSQALFIAFWNGHTEVSDFLYDAGAEAVFASRLQSFLSIFFGESGSKSYDIVKSTGNQ